MVHAFAQCNLMKVHFCDVFGAQSDKMITSRLRERDALGGHCTV